MKVMRDVIKLSAASLVVRHIIIADLIRLKIGLDFCNTN